MHSHPWHLIKSTFIIHSPVITLRNQEIPKSWRYKTISKSYFIYFSFNKYGLIWIIPVMFTSHFILFSFASNSLWLKKVGEKVCCYEKANITVDTIFSTIRKWGCRLKHASFHENYNFIQSFTKYWKEICKTWSIFWLLPTISTFFKIKAYLDEIILVQITNVQ